MTDEEIKQSRAICEAAPKGPWEYDRLSAPVGLDYVRLICSENRALSIVSDLRPMTVPVAEFIAHARTALPRALDALEELKAERDVLKERIGHLQDDVANLQDSEAKLEVFQASCCWEIEKERDALRKQLKKLQAECTATEDVAERQRSRAKVAEAALRYSQDAIKASVDAENAALAQVAALREALSEVLYSDADNRNPHFSKWLQFGAPADQWRDLLANTAQAAAQYEARVRREERERCAKQADHGGHWSEIAAAIRAIGGEQEKESE
jgi:DNA repair exonuclease SbcCD ATPase subunit